MRGKVGACRLRTCALTTPASRPREEEEEEKMRVAAPAQTLTRTKDGRKCAAAQERGRTAAVAVDGALACGHGALRCHVGCARLGGSGSGTLLRASAKISTVIRSKGWGVASNTSTSNWTAALPQSPTLERHAILCQQTRPQTPRKGEENETQCCLRESSAYCLRALRVFIEGGGVASCVCVCACACIFLPDPLVQERDDAVVAVSIATATMMISP